MLFSILSLVVVLVNLATIYGDVSDGAFVHLFEWKWNDIAVECETFLGPNQYHAIQVSPAMEHIQGPEWWTRYQPVSYKLESRSGTEKEFTDMIKKCSNAGVSIIIDGVINHMAIAPPNGEVAYGVAGTKYSNREFEPYCYDSSYTHTLQNSNDTNCVVDDYSNKDNVQLCDLNELVDLNTELEHVQDTIASYIKKYHDLGAAGYRVDAAKHIDSNSLATIIDKAPNMYCFQEVIAGDGEPITPQQYTANGDVTEFNFGTSIWETFQKDAENKVQNLDSFGESWGLIDSSKAVTFTDNHDTQRTSDNVLTYKDGYYYDMANYFMLAHPYGHPKVMSSYYFNDKDQGPPAVSVHSGSTVNCNDDQNWVCEHRRTGIAGMARFRSVVKDSAVDLWQKDSSNGNRIAFARSTKGFLALNMDANDTWDTQFDTGLPDGRYCNVIVSFYDNCNEDAIITVTNGKISVEIAPLQALALHI